MALGFQPLLCLSAILGLSLCLASSSASFVCYNCMDGMTSADPTVPSCTNVSSLLYWVKCTDEKACVKMISNMPQFDGSTKKVKFLSCQENVAGVSKEELEYMVKKDTCMEKTLPLLGKSKICACRNNLCNAATSQNINNLIKIVYACFFLFHLRRFF